MDSVTSATLSVRAGIAYTLIHGLLACAVILVSAPYARAQQSDLGRVLHEVERRAPQLQAAASNSIAAESRRSQVRSLFLGTIDAFAIDQHFNDDRLTRPISPPINLPALTFDDNQIGYGANLLLPIDVSGKLRHSLHSATHSARAAMANEENVRIVLLNNAARIYRGLERIAGNREALAKQAEALRAHIKVAETAIDVGRVAPVERLRLVAELKVVEGRLAGLDGAEAGLRARLAALLRTDAYTEPVAILTSIPDAFVPSDDLLTSRPDVRAAQEIEESLQSGVRAARSAYLPDIFASAGWMQNQGYNGSGKDDATWQVGVRVRLSLWSGGERRARIHEARAHLSASRSQQIAVRDNATAELASAGAAWSATRIQYEAAKSAVDAAIEVARIQADRFDEGRLSAADLVDAEAALAGARANLSNALSDWWSADDALRLAVGRAPAAYDGYHAEQ